jgi:hypothetical protein
MYARLGELAQIWSVTQSERVLATKERKAETWAAVVLFAFYLTN